MLTSLKNWARRIKRDGVMLWFACRDPRTPWWLKALAFLVVAYALSPIDLVPDFIPVLGFVDDVILLPVLIWFIVRHLPEHIASDCRQQADDWMSERGGKPVSRAGIVLVLLVWAVVAWLLWLGLWSTH
ncbi:YkvA family protein [Limnohabitans planktonicus]|uniref:DUF1232 domain-containing protein n=1 Tax=Limnohabitans planktonicus II-D5 TaxID=1293045 RepID=A0A2T7UB76_9BURK|nr:YkvA family protein [Limnohabitans planktonicus]PVE41939.1 hypothetical protein H663_014430 [Limnohabitans planktonicus II-D5]|eukprot:gene27971-31593_t